MRTQESPPRPKAWGRSRVRLRSGVRNRAYHPIVRSAHLWVNVGVCNLQMAKINDGIGPWHTWREVATIYSMTSSGSDLPFNGSPWADDDPKHPRRWCNVHRLPAQNYTCEQCRTGRVWASIERWRRTQASIKEAMGRDS